MCPRCKPRTRPDMPIDIKNLPKKDATPEEPQRRRPPRPEAERVTLERLVLEEERIYRRGVVTVKDLISPAAFEVRPTFLVLSGVYVRTLFVITYPRHIGLGLSTPIINLNRTIDVAMFFYP